MTVPWRRAGLILPAVAFGVLAVALYHIDGDDVVALVWVILLASSSVAVLGVMVNPRSHTLYMAAGCLMMTAIGTRPIGVFVNYWIGYLSNGWGVVAALVIYPSWAVTAGMVWFSRSLRDWQARHEVGATVDGD